MTEAELQQRCIGILKPLKNNGYLDYRRIPLGGVRGASGRQTNPMKGWPDLTLFIPGAVLFVELKTPTGKLSKEQIAFQAMCTLMGLSYTIVRTEQDLIELLQDFNVLPR